MLQAIPATLRAMPDASPTLDTVSLPDLTDYISSLGLAERPCAEPSRGPPRIMAA